MQILSMQRILMGLAMIVFVGALAAGATGAFFSDTESSTGNTFAAGELDLTIDNSSYGFDWNSPSTTTPPTGIWGPNAANSWALDDLDGHLFFSFVDLKPGDYGEDTISMHVQNNAYACMRFDLTATPDNGINEPEGDAGDVTDGDGGELQNFLSFMFWNDDGDNVYETGETIIPALTGLPGAAFTGNWLTIADSGAGTPLAAGVTTYLGKGWCFGTMTATPVTQDNASSTPPAPGRTGFTCSGADPLVGPGHNVAQTDGIAVDVEFYGVQSRNNSAFLCSSLEEGTPEVPVPATLMVDKIVQFTSTSVVGVDVNDFQLVLDGPGTGGDGIVVDQIATTTMQLGVYSISEVYSNDPAGIQFNASFSGGCTEVGDTGVGTMTVVAGVNPTCTITNLVVSNPIN